MIKKLFDNTESTHWHVELRQALMAYFDIGDLKTVCFDLGIDFNSIPGESKSEKVVELIGYVTRTGRVIELIDQCSKLRPNVPWDNLKKAAKHDPSVICEPGAQVIKSSSRHVPKWSWLILMITAIVALVAYALFRGFTKSDYVAFLTHNGRYVTAMNDEDNRDWVLRAETQTMSDWEKFILLCQDDGRVAFLTHHGRYITAMNDEGNRDWVLRAETRTIGDWEKFTLFSVETGAQLSCPTLKSLRQSKISVAILTHHGRYVTALDNKDGENWVLRGKSQTIGDSEKFILILP